MPPSSTPIAAPASIAPRTPSALLRSAPSWNVTSVIEKTDGASTADAAPWRMRPAISMPSVCASPHISEKAAKPCQPEHEELAPPQQVAGPAAQQQEAAEREGVAAHDPLEVLGREAEVGLDRGQGHVHDRDVEDHHQVGDAQDREGLPAVRVGARASVVIRPPERGGARRRNDTDQEQEPPGSQNRAGRRSARRRGACALPRGERGRIRRPPSAAAGSP